MSKGARGDRFLADFNRLKSLVGDDPKNLDASLNLGEEVEALCKNIAWHVRSFDWFERSSETAFTPYISRASIIARRDYEERWRTNVQIIGDKDLRIFVNSLMEDLPEEAAELSGRDTSGRGDELAAAIADWKYDATREAGQIEQIVEYASSKREMDDCGDFDWVDESLSASSRLATPPFG